MSSIILGLAYARFGSVAAGIAYFRNEPISVQPRLADVGEGNSGETRMVTVDVANWTDQPIRVIGGTSDCSCTVLGDLPVLVPPHQSRTVAVAMTLSGRPGIFTRKAGFLVERDGLQAVTFGLTGRILE
ncbi:MAG: DUF1573 domain-containing protein [Gemmataceae bacterium]|nr:DUF1573 domain-containing protein [Gemmataceae bacterium]